jgi:hypothetical protein
MMFPFLVTLWLSAYGVAVIALLKSFSFKIFHRTGSVFGGNTDATGKISVSHTDMLKIRGSEVVSDGDGAEEGAEEVAAAAHIASADIVYIPGSEAYKIGYSAPTGDIAGLGYHPSAGSLPGVTGPRTSALSGKYSM